MKLFKFITTSLLILGVFYFICGNFSAWWSEIPLFVYIPCIIVLLTPTYLLFMVMIKSNI